MSAEPDEPPAVLMPLAAYFDRIGTPPPLTPTLDGLVALHRAHCAAIPFENLDVLLGRRIALDLPSLARKLVHERRGGYCFEQSTLFRAVLQELGYSVSAFAARVRVGTTAVRPRTHMLLRVDLPEGPFLADVGFGGDGPVHPIPFVEQRETWIGSIGHRVRREGELWVLQGTTDGAWSDLYAFTPEPAYDADFEMANHYTSTYPDSRFVRNLVAQRSWPEKRAVLVNRELAVREGDRVERTIVRDPGHLLELLADLFDLRFPAGTRFSQPQF